MNVAVRWMAGGCGGLAVVLVSLSAIRTVVVPRGSSTWLTKTVFGATRSAFGARLHFARTYEQRDAVMALYAPLTLVLLPAVWLTLVVIGFAGVFMGLDGGSFRHALLLSGSSVTTLGFSAPDNGWADAFAVVEAGIGLGLVALMISYLPSIYSSFQRREKVVAMLGVRANDPPSAVDMLVRHHLIGWLDRSGDLFEIWEDWFADIEETHTSVPALAYFRSPVPGRSWITSAGAVLDGAALMASTVDVPVTPHAQLCLRSGYLALRRIADSFGIDYDPDPHPSDPITIDRTEFEAACDRLAERGVPLVADRDEAWVAFAGWRVNYDAVLVALAGLLMAPFAPWSSDRSPRVRVRSKFGRRAR